MKFILPIKKKVSILALGAESAGNFSFYFDGKIYLSEDFGDLLDGENFNRFKKAVKRHLSQNKRKTMILLTDLHPLYKTTALGEEFGKKLKIKCFKIQHHLAHIFSVLGEHLSKPQIPNSKLGDFLGLVCDGTGFGLDGSIWGGEIFKFKKSKMGYYQKIERVGHLENQMMIGGDMAVKEPARMLISILSKFLSKRETYDSVKKFYSKNQFELLHNQLQLKFNCQETSSTGRVLDAISVLLGFVKNQRNYKHEPIDVLEKNSTKSYQIRPEIRRIKNQELKTLTYELLTTPLFKYLIENLVKDRKRLAATAQSYLARGLYQIVNEVREYKKADVYFGGGIANNKIMANYLQSRGFLVNKTIPRGDAGISFGQIIYFLLTNPGD